MNNIKTFNLLWIFAGIFGMIEIPCHAFFGQSSIEQSTPPQTFMSAFPGLLDTNVAPHNSIVLELPTFAIDYGVTENWTLGTNALAVAATAYTLTPVVYLQSRYRFFSNNYISSTITGFGGRSWNGPIHSLIHIPDSPKFEGNLIGITSNTSYYFDKYNTLTFTLISLRLSFEKSYSSLDSVTTNIYTIAPGFGYQIVPFKFLALSTNFLFPINLNINTASLDRDTIETVKDPIFFKFSLTSKQVQNQH